ncbi:MAG TPA: polynucleotide kinase [Candidatus Kapabacteria bacterium]|nr:polynucleotide kinase [Candidatus Kapabacteria bacterium]
MPQKPYIICDLDGTLCDISHRQHHAQGKKKNWPKFFAGVKDDKLNEVVAEILARFKDSHDIVFFSGRPEKCRVDTLKWMIREADIHDPEIHMRADGDFRNDAIVKAEMYEAVEPKRGKPFFILDDRDRVVKMWRERGLTCLQVAEGDF